MALPTLDLIGWHHSLGKRGSTEQGELVVQRRSRAVSPSPASLSSSVLCWAMLHSHQFRPSQGTSLFTLSDLSTSELTALGPRPHCQPLPVAHWRGKKEVGLQQPARGSGWKGHRA